jgi:CBS-domain-containing membrane protein
MNAADVMTSDVFTLNAETTVLDAARLMLRHRVSGLPVVDWHGKLVGILTEGDLLRRAETGTEHHRAPWLEFLLGPGRAAEEYTLAHGRKVGELMTDQVIQVAPHTPLEQVVALMERHHVKRLPVVADDKLLGIVSRADLMRVLVDLGDKPVAAPTTDAEIRARVLAEMARQTWAPLGTMAIDVKDGIVELRGSITDERERAALRVACENVAGVKSVVDHLIWVEPLSGMVGQPPEEEKKR